LETFETHADLYGEVQEAFVNNMIRVLRVAGGLSKGGELLNMQKSELAKTSCLSKGTITKLTDPSTCHDAKPDLETLCKLAYALNISPAFLLMTSSDWAFLLQAVGILRMLNNAEGEKERPLVTILEESASKQVDEAVKSGLNLIETLHGEDYSSEERLRQRRGILVMTAIAQYAVRRQGIAKKMQATALGAFLGDREIAKH
jgi:transcriptional regulator with XRE-family HTH domain